MENFGQIVEIECKFVENLNWWMMVCLSVCLSVCRSVCLSVCLTFCPTFSLSVSCSVWLSVSLPACFSVCLYECRFVKCQRQIYVLFFISDSYFNLQSKPPKYKAPHYIWAKTSPFFGHKVTGFQNFIPCLAPIHPSIHPPIHANI